MLALLVEALDGLTGADPGSLSDAESVMALQREARRLEAVLSGVTARFDAEKTWQADGAQTAVQWLTHMSRLPKRDARRQVGLGRRARDLPAAQDAWLAGEIGSEHVRVLAAARTDATAARMAVDEPMLVEQAKILTFAQFQRLVAYWLQRADPDGADEDDEVRRARRDAYLTESFQGEWFGKLRLDPVGGAIVGGELGRIEKEFFQADWREAKARLGREPTLGDLARTPGQRRADAFVEMATRSNTAPADGQRPAPLFSVLVGYETMHGRICELAAGRVVAPGALVPWLDQAYIERAVFEGRDRVINVGVRRRLFGGGTRRAVELASRECYHPLCDVPADRCEADHVIPYPDGGLTTVDNGRMACDFHNRWRVHNPDP